MNDKARTADNLDNELASLPEKYKGKTVADVVRMHQELEQAYSRQGNELGEYRRLASTLAENTTRTSYEKVDERPAITTDDLIADPAKAIDNVIESHPAVKRARETSDNLERQLAYRNFEQAHPKFRDALQTQEFRDWVQSSASLVRLAQRSDAYDFEAADQLFGLWEEKQSIKQNAEKIAKDIIDKKEKERAGTLEGATGADASNDVVLNRAELRLLQQKAMAGDKTALAKWNDPKFRAMRLKAYADGRVS